MLIGDGLSGPANPSEGARLFLEAAEKGSADGQNAIGYSYLAGEGVSKDFGKALFWFSKAAAQGNTKADCAKLIEALRQVVQPMHSRSK